MFSDRINDFRFFVKFHKSGLSVFDLPWRMFVMNVCYASKKLECLLCIKKAPKDQKHLINMVCVALKGLWMISDKILDFQLLVKFHLSGCAIILRF